MIDKFSKIYKQQQEQQQQKISRSNKLTTTKRLCLGDATY